MQIKENRIAKLNDKGKHIYNSSTCKSDIEARTSFFHKSILLS